MEYLWCPIKMYTTYILSKIDSMVHYPDRNSKIFIMQIAKIYLWVSVYYPSGRAQYVDDRTWVLPGLPLATQL